VFVAAYFLTKDMILATKVLIAASALQIAGYWLLKRTAEKMHLATFAILVVLGGLTIALQDQAFIMWKPTIVNWLFAIVFLGSQFIGRRNLVRTLVEAFLKQMPHHKLELPEEKWLPLNLSFVVFFVLLGGTNLLVVYNFDQDTWVAYKMVGQSILNMLFLLAQFAYLSRYIREEHNENKPEAQG
ncbi:MAG TPA: inner membrane-spanning protein YciB, partial [Candidatus Kapabacteria bacterium]|nr:inner membrane-spanning protein YciB [Candidatus Kapabacteria bacterium]